MKVRKSVSGPKFSHYFSFEFKYASLKNNILYNTQIFNAVSFSLFFLLSALVVGFFRPVFWVAGLSYCSLLLFLYFRTKKLAHGITIVRKAPGFAREKTTIPVKYLIRNESGFSLEQLSFFESFEGVQSSSFEVRINRKISAQTQFEINKEVHLDAGMGIKSFKPLTFAIQDELGIFDFKIEFQNQHEIEVFPFIEETPSFINSISPETIEYGLYEIPKRGDSNLFIGVREYRHGDPVKFINWKLSKRTDKLVINEFEKNTNTFVTLILDLDLEHQTGQGQISSWELLKDLALSIGAREIRRNNHVQVLAHNLFIPFSSGKAQLETMERHFTYHELTSAGKKNFHHYLHDLPHQGQVYYITPKYLTLKNRETFDLLGRLKFQGQNVICLLIDPYEELNKHTGGAKKLGILEMDRMSSADFAKLQSSMKNINIPLITVKVSRETSLNEQLVKEAFLLLETR